MVIASSHVFVFPFWWKVPKGYKTLVPFFVSARRIKRHYHHLLQDQFALDERFQLELACVLLWRLCGQAEMEVRAREDEGSLELLRQMVLQ